MSIELMRLQDRAEDMAIKKLDHIGRVAAKDPEGAHSDCDNILLQFIRDTGFEEVADAYNKVVESRPW